MNHFQIFYHQGHQGHQEELERNKVQEIRSDSFLGKFSDGRKHFLSSLLGVLGVLGG
jgi:hypothetical protein